MSQSRATWARGIAEISSCVYGVGEFPGACFGDVSAVAHQDRVAHLIGGGNVVGDVKDGYAMLIGQPAARAIYGSHFVHRRLVELNPAWQLTSGRATPEWGAVSRVSPQPGAAPFPERPSGVTSLLPVAGPQGRPPGLSSLPSRPPPLDRNHRRLFLSAPRARLLGRPRFREIKPSGPRVWNASSSR
jgi:hypothetical protein